MTATTIIQEIERLPPSEQAEVVRFAYQLDATRRLSGNELSALAEKMTTCDDPTEAAMIRNEIVRGFYGSRQNA